MITAEQLARVDDIEHLTEGMDDGNGLIIDIHKI